MNINDALTYLSKDSILQKIIDKYPAPVWKKDSPLYEDLIESIIVQQ
jgi:hypothetical protein